MRSFLEFNFSSELFFAYAFNYLLVYFFATFGILTVFSLDAIDSNNLIKKIKNLTYDNFLFFSLITFLSNLIGIPPLGGFIAKSVLLTSLSHKYDPLLYFGFFFFILLSTVFYIQLLKLLKKSKIKSFMLKSNRQIFYRIFVCRDKFFQKQFIVWLLFFNLFYLFFYKDFLLLLYIM